MIRPQSLPFSQLFLYYAPIRTKHQNCAPKARITALKAELAYMKRKKGKADAFHTIPFTMNFKMIHSIDFNLAFIL